MDNFKAMSKKRFEALTEAAISYSGISTNDVPKVEAYVNAYNNKFGTSFFVDKKLNEIVHAGIVKEGTFGHFDGLRSLLERKGWETALGESRASTKSSLERLMESELEQAEVVLAAQSVTDRLQKMAEDLAQMISDDVLPITDQMKATFGTDTAERWGHTAKESLENAFNQITDVKDKIGSGTQSLQQELEGGTPATNDMADFGDEDEGSNMDLDVGDEEGDVDLDVDAGEEGEEVDLDLDVDAEEEEPLGRAKKESRNYGSKKSLKENLGKKLYNLVYDAPWAKADPKEIARRLRGQDDEFIDEVIQRGENSELGGPAKIQYQLAKKEKARRQGNKPTESLTEEMVFVAGRDFEPVVDYKGYTLGKFEDRDDDVRKVDYAIYKFVGEETPEGMPRPQKKYKEIKRLDASPYIRPQEAAVLFKQAVDTMPVNEDDDPCWKGYRQLGMKTKDGEKVPNCIPETVTEDADFSKYVDPWREKGFDINVRKAGGDAQNPHLLFRVRKDGETFEIEEPRTGVYKTAGSTFDSFDDAMKHAGTKLGLLEVYQVNEHADPSKYVDRWTEKGYNINIVRLGGDSSDPHLLFDVSKDGVEFKIEEPTTGVYRTGDETFDSFDKAMRYLAKQHGLKETRVSEDEPGNPFTYAALQARKAGKDTFKFKGKTYPVEEALTEDDEEAERAVMAMIKGKDELPEPQDLSPAAQTAKRELDTAVARNPNLKRAIQQMVGEAIQTINEDVEFGISLDVALRNAARMYGIPQKKLTEIYMRK